MSDLDDLTAFLTSGSTIESLAGAVGASEADTRQAIGAAVPALLGGLAVEANDPSGEAALTDALQADHGGSIFDQLDAVLGGGSGKQFDGAGILGHIFGDQQEDVVQSLSSKTGASQGLLVKLLPILAPVVMGWLAKRLTARSAGGGGAASSQAAPAAPAGGSGGGSGGVADILSSVLGAGSGGGGGSSSGGGGLIDVIGSVLGGGQGQSGGSGGLGDLLSAVLGGRQ